MSPLLLIGGLLMWVSSVGFGVWYGMDLGQDKEYAKRAREDAIIQKVSDAAQTAAATAIAANKPVNQTIVQRATREVQTNTVYRDCRNTVNGLRDINQALTGTDQPAGDSQLPSASPTK